jgi:hypothetical protein
MNPGMSAEEKRFFLVKTLTQIASWKLHCGVACRIFTERHVTCANVITAVVIVNSPYREFSVLAQSEITRHHDATNEWWQSLPI